MPSGFQKPALTALTFVLGVLLCLAGTASGVAITSPEKTAPGDFFGVTPFGTGKIVEETLQPRRGEAASLTELASGRRCWLSPDPIAENGGVNLYSYVRNDLVNYWDPLGLADCALGVSGTGAAIGGATGGGGVFGTNDSSKHWYDSWGVYLTVGGVVGVDISVSVDVQIFQNGYLEGRTTSAGVGMGPGGIDLGGVDEGNIFDDAANILANGEAKGVCLSGGGGLPASATVKQTETRLYTPGDLGRLIKKGWGKIKSWF